MDAWIKFDGIAGSSTNKLHKNETEVLAWNWGVSEETAGDSRAGRARPHDFTFLHAYDKASTLLARAAASGKLIKEVLLTVARGGESQRDFFKVTLKDVLVSGVDISGDDEDLLAEVSLRPRFIGISYAETSSAGTLESPVTIGWDVASNKVT